MGKRAGNRTVGSGRRKHQDPRLAKYDKIYVLDTNVLVHDPTAIEKFRDNVIIIPIWVVEELDRLKKDNRLGEVAMNARVVSRKLRNYKTEQGSLLKGVRTETGGLLFTDYNGVDFSKLPVGLERKNDNRIILVALSLQEKHPNHRVTIVTKDANLDITADACGVKAEDYESDKVLKNVSELYTGRSEVVLPPAEAQVLTALYREKQLPIDGFSFAGHSAKLHPNTCCRLEVEGSDNYVLAILKKVNGVAALQLVDRKKSVRPGSVGPRNDEQHLFSALINDPTLSLVTCAGKAGTGKTLVALLSCYQLIDKPFERLIIYRPLSEVGKGVGFLPGDLEEKFAHYTLPIYDNFSLISGEGPPSSDDPKVQKGKSRPLRDLISQGVVEIEPFTFIRGRSLNRCIILVDEAQNMTPHEAKTLITRAGFDSKIVMVGDPYQIDNPHLDSLSNGLSYVVEHFKGQPMFGHITLTKGERSPLAELAADIL